MYLSRLNVLDHPATHLDAVTDCMFIFGIMTVICYMTSPRKETKYQHSWAGLWECQQHPIFRFVQQGRESPTHLVSGWFLLQTFWVLFDWAHLQGGAEKCNMSELFYTALPCSWWLPGRANRAHRKTLVFCVFSWKTVFSARKMQFSIPLPLLSFILHTYTFLPSFPSPYTPTSIIL